jgi:predicted DNA-binding transcriptional regulator YafY
MTSTTPNISSIEDIEVMARRIEAAAQKQVAEDIARLKAMGKPIYYEMGSKLVREESNGSKFEYRLRADGSEEILAELH